MIKTELQYKEYKHIIGIDPGTEQTAITVFNIKDRTIEYSEIVPNDTLLMPNFIVYKNHNIKHTLFCLEMIQSYGMKIGNTTIDTVYFIGKIANHLKWIGFETVRVKRKEVILHLCNDPRAKDKNIRAELINRFPPDGGGKIPQIGTKKNPGPLYGISKDQWQSLSLCIYLKDKIYNPMYTEILPVYEP